ncbi:MAG: hypothetical protein NDJ90_04245 [Oligoflexia bacterium]|nr:hypothetical protein [Oligoflexia bacterium]
MKTAKTLTQVLTLCLSLAPGLALGAGPEYPRSVNDVTQSLDSQVLSREMVADLLNSTAEAPAQPFSDLERFLPRPGQGPGMTEERLAGAYTAAELIAVALEEKDTFPFEERIEFLKEQAGRIIEVSGDRPTELLLRLTLGRSVDVTSHVLPIAGRNSAYVTRLLANFLRENFELAAGFGNNPMAVSSRFKSGGRTDTAEFLRKVSIAEYGRVYATLLWRYSQDLSSDSSKAVLLMRLLGYLGWDFNADLRRRERPIAQTIVDIYSLQHGELYQRILGTMRDGREPAQEDVAQLRRRTYTILERIPARLQSLNITPISGATF